MSWYRPGPTAVYLYDGVSAEDQDGMIVLSVNRGGRVEFVCLEDRAIEELLRFLERERGIKVVSAKAEGRP